MGKTIKKILILMLGLAIGGAIAFYKFKGSDGNSILDKKDGSIDTSKADKKENLSNGDTITITMNFKNNSDLNIDINKKKLVKKVKIKGLEKIVNSLDDFDEDTLDRMNADANKILAEDYNDPKEGTNRSFYNGDKVNYEFTRINIFEKKLSEEEILEKNKFDNQKSYSIAMVYKVKFDEVKDTEYDSDSEKRIISKKEEKAINQVKYDGFELVEIEENEKAESNDNQNYFSPYVWFLFLPAAIF